MIRFPRLCVLALVALSLTACGESSESWQKVEETSGATWDAVKTWSAEKAGEARTALKKKMDDMEPQLAAARIAAKKGGEQTAAELEQAVENAKTAFAALKEATGPTWRAAIEGVQKAYEALQAKIDALTK